VKKNKEWSHAESEELDYREEPLLTDVFNKAQGEIREMCEKVKNLIINFANV